MRSFHFRKDNQSGVFSDGLGVDVDDLKDPAI
jgi:hypothetical protein